MKRFATIAALALAACGGTTGGELVEFDAFASGPEGAVAGSPYRFTSGRGWDVTLSRARLHVASVYLNQAQVVSVSQDTRCTLGGIYAAEVTTGLTIDAIDGAPQPFPARGRATSDRARTGEVWLGGGRGEDEVDPTVVLDVAGTATKGRVTIPFEGQLTISTNRRVPAEDPALPGRNPICKQRVVSPIPVDLTPNAGGALLVRVDPAGWFGNVDFATLAPDAVTPGLYRFADAPDDQASENLFLGLRASVGAYTFSWR
jgi:hypothetical protein